MSYRLQNKTKIDYLLKNEDKQNIIKFDDSKSIGEIGEIKFDNGLSLIKSDIIFKDNYELQLNSSSKNIIFTFLLDGISCYDSSLYKFNIDAKKDHTTIVMDNNSKGTKSYAKNTHHKSIQLFLKEEYIQTLLKNEFFEHYLIKKFNKNIDFLECIKLSKTSLRTKINLNEIFNTPFSGSFNSLYIQSKILDILSIELKELLSPKLEKNKEIKFSEYDKQALYRAKEILIQNMDNPPSLSSLSKIIKLNEFKLKIGFKKTFNNTPYGLLFEYKMQKAKELLKTSEYDINEIALKVGYKHPCNFTTAFSKKFGVNPKELMKSRKYYY